MTFYHILGRYATLYGDFCKFRDIHYIFAVYFE